MPATFGSSRILNPVKPWFIYSSLAGALFLNFLPTSYWPGMPDWVAVVLAFWCVHHPRRVGMGWAFVLGLLMDVADGAALGQHSLAYVPLAFLAGGLARRILWFPIGQQALHVLPMLLLVQCLQAVVRLAVGADLPGWGYFVSPLVATALWIPVTFVLLLPQFRPVERDENRPI